VTGTDSGHALRVVNKANVNSEESAIMMVRHVESGESHGGTVRGAAQRLMVQCRTTDAYLQMSVRCEKCIEFSIEFSIEVAESKVTYNGEINCELQKGVELKIYGDIIPLKSLYGSSRIYSTLYR
jgi:hypothetical protein